MQGSERALTMCGVGEEGCLSVNEHLELASYLRKWIGRIENTVRSDNRIFQEEYTFNTKEQPCTLTNHHNHTELPTLIIYRLSP